MKIISNHAMSLDGKLSTINNDHVNIGSIVDQVNMRCMRCLADAVIVGGNTFRNAPYPMIPKDKCEDKDLNKNPIYNVIITRQLPVVLNDVFLLEKRIKPVFITTQKEVSKEFPCEVIVIDGEITAKFVVQKLASWGVQTTLIEGGGDLMFQFLTENLIDEMYVTLCPKIIGGRVAPSLVSGDGFSQDNIKKLELIENKKIGDEIFLHYKVRHYDK